jgi:hypothetical protein
MPPSSAIGTVTGVDVVAPCTSGDADDGVSGDVMRARLMVGGLGRLATYATEYDGDTIVVRHAIARSQQTSET